MKTNIENLQSENRQLKQQVENLENKLDYLEGQSKRNNVIIHGLEEDGRNESWAMAENKLRDFLRDNLGISQHDVDNMPIERAHRMKRLLLNFSTIRIAREFCRLQKIQDEITRKNMKISEFQGTSVQRFVIHVQNYGLT